MQKKETLSYQFIHINSKINFVTLLPPALRWVGDDNGLPSNSDILKTVRANIVFTRATY